MGRLVEQLANLAGKPTAECECCLPTDVVTTAIEKARLASQQADKDDSFVKAGGTTVLSPADEAGGRSVDIQELTIIGAGPHALALVLRLLEPEPDFLSDKERHLRADFLRRMRPLSQVRRHVADLSRGPRATLKPPKKSSHANIPSPLSLEFVRTKVTVLDASGNKWMANWDQNFEEMNIQQLRSPIGAHADPYDHRGLEFYAERHKRSDELIPLESVPRKMGRWDFHGPFNVPSTSLFSDFQQDLAKAYGVSDIVQQGKVVSITPRSTNDKDDDDESSSSSALFDLVVQDPHGRLDRITTKRVVCAMGPANNNAEDDHEFVWEDDLKKQVLADVTFCAACNNGKSMRGEPRFIERESLLRCADQCYCDLVLRSDKIVPWLSRNKAQMECHSKRLLIVGGGITSAHLALLAANRSKSPWCSSVTLIQRTGGLERQFDIPNEWMGPGRGKLQQEFWALDPDARVQRIAQERQGGSIAPEVLKDLRKAERGGKLKTIVGVDIVSVDRNQNEKSLQVLLSDGSSIAVDMIWLATGFRVNLRNYPCLAEVESVLPITKVKGLPVLNKDLSWGDVVRPPNRENEDPKWKEEARRRLWIMGALAAVELGPDALNLMGGRQGAVRVARSVLKDLATDCDSLSAAHA